MGGPPEGSRAFLSIHAVNVFVRDQDASLRFFLDQLGFDLAFDGQLQSGDRWVAVAPPDGSAVLSLIVPRPNSKDYALIGRPTGIVFVAEDVLATYNQWRARGVQFLTTPKLRRVRYERPDSHATPSPVWGGVFTRFRDMDGNLYSLVGIDEINREIQARRRRLAEQQEAERRAAQELEIAQQVQARLFPQRLPAVETLDYAGVCLQARQVGGDYYDFLDLDRGRIGLVIGDICGKGIAASLLMANLQANLRSQYALALDQPERLLRAVNQLFHENTAQSAYATLFFAEYESASRALRYVNCGHLPALLLHGEAVERLHSTSTVVGLFPDWDCSVEQCQLTPGDLLALYTDGITESFNAAGEDFGEHRLIDALRRYGDRSPRDVIAAIVEEIRRFSPNEQHDDITMIVAKCH
jgi:serine phosphatase RsbU (regulator of sigma subunit)